MAAKLTKDVSVVSNSGIELTYLNGDLNIIQKLDDEPNDVGGLTSAELKAKFDEGANIIKDFINESLIPEVLADGLAEEARASAETVRNAAEEGRVAAEKERVQAESGRSTAEAARVLAEDARNEAESLRKSAEFGRSEAETFRTNQEDSRNMAESTRSNNEYTRQEAEALRASSEAQRVEQENTRQDAEIFRSNAEAKRARAEDSRVSAETLRVNAEASRKSNEQARVDKESIRVVDEGQRVHNEEARESAERVRVAAEKARNVWEDYSSSKTYVKGNKVYWQGSSYVCIGNPYAGVDPSNASYWQLVARSGVTGEGVFGFDVVDGRLICYYEGDDPPPFRLGADGHLYADLDDGKSIDLGNVSGSGGSGPDPSLGVTGATVGQIVQVSAVDEEGKPTAWVPVDMPSGDGEENWELIGTVEITEEISAIELSEDLSGAPFELKKLAVYAPSSVKASQDGQLLFYLHQGNSAKMYFTANNTAITDSAKSVWAEFSSFGQYWRENLTTSTYDINKVMSALNGIRISKSTGQPVNKVYIRPQHGTFTAGTFYFYGVRA